MPGSDATVRCAVCERADTLLFRCSACGGSHCSDHRDHDTHAGASDPARADRPSLVDSCDRCGVADFLFECPTCGGLHCSDHRRHDEHGWGRRFAPLTTAWASATTSRPSLPGFSVALPGFPTGPRQRLESSAERLRGTLAGYDRWARNRLSLYLSFGGLSRPIATIRSVVRDLSDAVTAPLAGGREGEVDPTARPVEGWPEEDADGSLQVSRRAALLFSATAVVSAATALQLGRPAEEPSPEPTPVDDVSFGYGGEPVLAGAWDGGSSSSRAPPAAPDPAPSVTTTAATVATTATATETPTPTTTSDDSDGGGGGGGGGSSTPTPTETPTPTPTETPTSTPTPTPTETTGQPQPPQVGGYSRPPRGTTDWHVPLNENFAAIERDVSTLADLLEVSVSGNYDRPQKGTADWHVPLNDNFAAIESDVQNLASAVETSPTVGGYNRPAKGSQDWHLPINENFLSIEEDLTSIADSL